MTTSAIRAKEADLERVEPGARLAPIALDLLGDVRLRAFRSCQLLALDWQGHRGITLLRSRITVQTFHARKRIVMTARASGIGSKMKNGPSSSSAR